MKILPVLICPQRGMFLEVALLLAWGFASSGCGTAKRIPAARDNYDLARLYREDQMDRTPINNAQIDWKKMQANDLLREGRVKEIYRAKQLSTGADYYYAAVILQHANTADEYLLAHE